METYRRLFLVQGDGLDILQDLTQNSYNLRALDVDDGILVFVLPVWWGFGSAK